MLSGSGKAIGNPTCRGREKSANCRSSWKTKAKAAERAYRSFRTAESDRVLASYGSGNGGGLAFYKTTIEMNLARIKQLKDQ